jgi:putative hydrolase of the HAD superfamily
MRLRRELYGLMPHTLDHIDTWIFDLDNTLYPASCDLFALIDTRMGQFIQDLLDVDPAEARRIQKGHFHQHGTTLTGLRHEHDVEPRAFLDFVHDIPMDRITPDPALKLALMALPGRRLVFTNGDAPYANRVLSALDLDDCFEAVFDIYAADLVPKPDPRPYAALCDTLNVEPARALFVEDMARNLKPAKSIGMATVWINNGSDYGAAEACASFIDYETDCASAWLNQITGELTQ